MGMEKQDMVRCTFSDGRVEDLHITDAICHALNMIDLYGIGLDKDPAGDKEPIITEVEFLDSSLADHRMSKDLQHFIKDNKEKQGYATA